MHNVSPFYLHCASSGLYTLYVPQLCEYCTIKMKNYSPMS